MIDQTDRKILHTLLEDGRLSYRQVAKKTGVSVVTVMHRVDKLRDAGIIKKFTTIIDYDKLDFDAEAIIELKIARNKGTPYAIEPFILKHPNVQAVYNVAGESDNVLLVKFRDRRQLNEFLKRLNSTPSVEATNTRFILNNFKEEPVRP